MYTIDPITHTYAYSLMTAPCAAKILAPLPTSEISVEENYSLSGDDVRQLWSRLEALESKAVAWFDLKGN